MGWANCGEDNKGRPIGYAHAALCDAEDCEEQIDRGLGFACGDMHGEEGVGGEPCCENYYCWKHMQPDKHTCEFLKAYNAWYYKTYPNENEED